MRRRERPGMRRKEIAGQARDEEKKACDEEAMLIGPYPPSA